MKYIVVYEKLKRSIRFPRAQHTTRHSKGTPSTRLIYVVAGSNYSCPILFHQHFPVILYLSKKIPIESIPSVKISFPYFHFFFYCTNSIFHCA